MRQRCVKHKIENILMTRTILPDLFYRLNVLKIDVPALRHRREDVAPLVAYFTEQYCIQNKERKVFLATTLPYLENYTWPGNVR